MKKSLPAVSASYDLRFHDLHRSSGRILSASRTVLKTHRGYYIMYTLRLQGHIFYNYMNFKAGNPQNPAAGKGREEDEISP